MRFNRSEVSRRPVRSRGLALRSATDLKPLRSPAKRALTCQRRSARLLLWSGVVSRSQLRDLGSSPGLSALPLSSRSRLAEARPSRQMPEDRAAAAERRSEAVRHAAVVDKTNSVTDEQAMVALGVDVAQNADPVRASGVKTSNATDSNKYKELEVSVQAEPQDSRASSSRRKVAPPKPPRPSRSATNLRASTYSNRKSGPSTKSAPSLMAASVTPQPSGTISDSAPTAAPTAQHSQQHISDERSSTEPSPTDLSQISPKVSRHPAFPPRRRFHFRFPRQQSRSPVRRLCQVVAPAHAQGCRLGRPAG